MNVTISNPIALYASALHQSTENTRYYLNSVLVEPRGDGGVLLVATDGHRLSVSYDADATHDGIGKGVILPVAKSLYRHLTSKKSHHVVWRDAPFDGVLAVMDERDNILSMAPSTPIDGSYPDWRRVIGGEKVAAPQITFNASYLAMYEKITRALRLDPPGVTFIPGNRGKGCRIAIDGADWWSGYLMPFDDRGRAFLPPEWLIKTKGTNND